MITPEYNINTFLREQPYALEIVDVENEVRHRFSAANIMQTRVQTLPDTDVAYLNITVMSSNNLIKLSFENEYAAIQAKVQLDQSVVEILSIGAISQITKWSTRPTEKKVIGQIGFNITTKKMEYYDGIDWQVITSVVNN